LRGVSGKYFNGTGAQVQDKHPLTVYPGCVVACTRRCAERMSQCAADAACSALQRSRFARAPTDGSRGDETRCDWSAAG